MFNPNIDSKYMKTRESHFDSNKMFARLLTHNCHHGKCPMEVAGVSKSCPYMLKNCSEMTENAWMHWLYRGTHEYMPFYDLPFFETEVEAIGFIDHCGRFEPLIERGGDEYDYNDADERFVSYAVRLTDGEIKKLTLDEFLLVNLYVFAV